MKLLSILIPTRGRAAKLLRCVESIRGTTSAERVEVLLRGDDDDGEFAALRIEYNQKWENVYFIAGPRHDGYASLHKFYDELSRLAIGHWAMIMNDDATVDGKGWDEELAGVPEEGWICDPYWHILGGSGYCTQPGGSPFPIVVNKFWTKAGHEEIGGCVDGWMHAIARDLGWKQRCLNRLIVKHDRQVDGTLPAERF